METWPKSPMLYCNAEGSVMLLDAPASISMAQSDEQSVPRLWLRSPAGPEAPFTVPEPRSAAAEARVRARLATLTDSSPHVDLIASGLDEIRRHHDGPWNLLRRPPDEHDEHERRLDSAQASTERSASAAEPPLDACPLTGSTPGIINLPAPPQTLLLPSASSLRNRLVRNSHSGSAVLHIASRSARYHIPPGATFLHTALSPTSTTGLSRALLAAAPEPSATAAPGQFDLVLLDPPWANRSARRSSAYRHASSNARGDPLCGLREALAPHIAPDGIVACWVTHAHAVRAELEQAFETWGVEAREEWTWAKVTGGRVPAVPLSSHWRRTWEVLVIGRRVEGVDKETSPDEIEDHRSLKRRLIVSVTDVHSRKPCLKTALEKYVLGTGARRVLEVFARNLVAGWCSIGDEVHKYNWHGHWVEVSEDYIERPESCLRHDT